MKTSDFDYLLPQELIAQVPIEPRDNSRLMIYDRKTGQVHHAKFSGLPDYLSSGDVLVINDTRVYPARLRGEKSGTRGKCEILLLRELDKFEWEAIVGGSGIREGIEITLGNGISAKVTKVLEGAQRILRFSQPVRDVLSIIGIVPLPPYIKEYSGPNERYQTIFADIPGSAAAPTAGLHFTNELIRKILEKGIEIARVTLHIGLDTFLPVTEEIPQLHPIHSEWCQLSAAVAGKINIAHRNGNKIVAVGTTSVRVLETAWSNRNPADIVGAYEGFTDLFIFPGYKFNVVDSIITNFHLPESTLIMLVAAFAGLQEILYLYQVAIEKKYRFYSFGDAMLII